MRPRSAALCIAISVHLGVQHAQGSRPRGLLVALQTPRCAVPHLFVYRFLLWGGVGLDKEHLDGKTSLRVPGGGRVGASSSRSSSAPGSVHPGRPLGPQQQHLPRGLSAEAALTAARTQAWRSGTGPAPQAASGPTPRFAPGPSTSRVPRCRLPPGPPGSGVHSRRVGSRPGLTLQCGCSWGAGLLLETPACMPSLAPITMLRTGDAGWGGAAALLLLPPLESQDVARSCCRAPAGVTALLLVAVAPGPIRAVQALTPRPAGAASSGRRVLAGAWS